MHTLRLLADPERLGIDVGANYGIYTVVLGKSCKNCIAFEPNRSVAAAAERRARDAGLTNVEVRACALSDRDGEVTFRVPLVDGVESDAFATIEDDNSLSGRPVHSYTVPCRRMDSFDLDPVGVIKIDAEGHETAILEGARAVFGRDRPAVLIEVEERHKKGSVSFVENFFSDLGYEGFFLMGRHVVPLSQFDLNMHQNTSNMEGPEIRLDAVYVNNFIFVADDRRAEQFRMIARAGRSL